MTNKELFISVEEQLAEIRISAMRAGNTAWYRALNADINCTGEQARKAAETAERTTLARLFKQTEPTCQVKNLDTGETKTMTRESAKKLQAAIKDICDWFSPTSYLSSVLNEFPFEREGIYTYRLKLKETLLVRLDGKLMSREAAIARYEALEATHEIQYACVGDGDWIKYVYPICAIDAFQVTHVYGQYQLIKKLPIPVVKKQESIKESINNSKPNSKPHYRELEGYEIAGVINTLTQIAVVYGTGKQIRQTISNAIVPFLKNVLYKTERESPNPPN